MKKIIYLIIIFVSIFVLSNSINAWSKYEIGQEVEYNGIKFYVIKDSDENNDTVTLLKADPLKIDDLDGASFSDFSIIELNGYILIAYDSPQKNADYDTSYVKQVVDTWAKNNVISKDYKFVRLIDRSEIQTEIRERDCCGGCGRCIENSDFVINEWLYNSNYSYWTMTIYPENSTFVWTVQNYGWLISAPIDASHGKNAVRPVIELYKSALGDTNEQEEINKDDTSIVTDNNSKKESKVAVNVPNTLEKISIIFIMIGIVLVSVSVVIVVRNRNIFNKKNGEK